MARCSGGEWEQRQTGCAEARLTAWPGWAATSSLGTRKHSLLWPAPDQPCSHLQRNGPQAQLPLAGHQPVAQRLHGSQVALQTRLPG